jgi:hypothetical protein
MRFVPLSSLCLSLLALSACDEIAVANDPEALADLRGQKNCIKAVSAQNGGATAAVNTTIPVIETNYFVIDVQGGKSWTCITDDKGMATQIVERRA